jgi:hypothetical protein
MLREEKASAGVRQPSGAFPLESPRPPHPNGAFSNEHPSTKKRQRTAAVQDASRTDRCFGMMRQPVEPTRSLDEALKDLGE